MKRTFVLAFAASLAAHSYRFDGRIVATVSRGGESRTMAGTARGANANIIGRVNYFNGSFISTGGFRNGIDGGSAGVPVSIAVNCFRRDRKSRSRTRVRCGVRLRSIANTCLNAAASTYKYNSF
jgi:hypothetical protein